MVILLDADEPILERPREGSIAVRVPRIMSDGKWFMVVGECHMHMVVVEQRGLFLT